MNIKHTLKEKLFWAWLSGMIDGDGSIFINLREQRSTIRPYLAVSAFINVNQKSSYRFMLEYIKENAKVGSIYDTRKEKNPKSYWQTTSQKDTIFICYNILPYIFLKKRQVLMMLEALKIWNKTDTRSPENMRRKMLGETIRNQVDVLKIIDIATKMNIGRSSIRYRGYHDYNYWKPLIEKWYPLTINK